MSLKDKIKRLIEKSADENLWYQYTKEKTTTLGSWAGVTVERLPRMTFENVTNLTSIFAKMPNLKRVEFYIDAKNCTNFNQLFQGSGSLEYVKGINTSKAINVIDMFYQCTSLKTIEDPLDFSSQTSVGGVFGACNSLEDVRIVEGSIKKTFYFTQSSKLTAESIQSIIDGLATVETAQTLTLHKDVKAKLTQTQLDTITGKNWSLA